MYSGREDELKMHLQGLHPMPKLSVHSRSLPDICVYVPAPLSL